MSDLDCRWCAMERTAREAEREAYREEITRLRSIVSAADAMRDACLHAHEYGCSVEFGTNQRVSTRIDAALVAFDRVRGEE